MSDMLNVFISYAREDGREYADRLYNDLIKRGFAAWRDERDLNPYQDFSAEIEVAIRRADYVVVCLTPSIADNLQSFVRREIFYSQNRQKPIIPLVFPGGELPVQIAHLTYIPFSYTQQDRQVDFDGGLQRFYKRLDESPKFVPTPVSSDAFQSYLELLYEQIVDFLDSTVFSLIALHTKPTPDAVDTPKEIKARALPMGFKALPVKEKPTAEEPEHFNDFPTAFEHYGGRVLLLGEPGAGKTTTLFAYAREAVARRLEDPTQPLPLLAPISSYPAVNQVTPLHVWLASQISALDAATIHRILTEGRSLLLLDALDELGGPRPIDPDRLDSEKFDPGLHFLSALTEMVGAQRTAPTSPHLNRVLVSCRVTDYADLGHKLPLKGAITLEPLDDAQMAEYLADQPDLWAAVQADETLRDLARTPLLLSILTYAYAGMGEEAKSLRDLSHSPADLRDKIFETYMRRRYEHEELRSAEPLPFTLEETVDVLGYAAMRDIALLYFEDSLHSYLQSRLGDRTGVFISCACHLHFLTEGEGELRFVHMLFRDYLGAFFSFSHIQDTEADVRSSAAKALGQLKDVRAVEALVSVLHDPDYWVRSSAIAAVGSIGDSQAVEELMSILHHDPDDWVRSLAALSLGLTGDSRAVEGLISALHHDPDNLVRCYSVDALGSIGDSQAVERLIHILHHDPDDWMRRSTARALGLIGDREAVGALISALHDPDDWVCSFAAEALVEIGGIEVVDNLCVVLQDNSASVRRSAVEALGKLRDARAVEALLIALHDPDAGVRGNATWALGQTGDKRAVEALLDAFHNNTDMRVRSFAAEALQKLGYNADGTPR
jgi:HEAT repeat protein